MSDYGGLPRNAAVDSVASNYASDARISPEVERILRQTATVTSNTPALSPTRPPATLLAQGPPSPSGASRQAQPILPRPSSTNSLGSGSVLSVAVPGTAPSATPLPPLSSGQMSPTGGKKESRRTVLSHDEEVRASANSLPAPAPFHAASALLKSDLPLTGVRSWIGHSFAVPKLLPAGFSTSRLPIPSSLAGSRVGLFLVF